MQQATNTHTILSVWLLRKEEPLLLLLLLAAAPASLYDLHGSSIDCDHFLLLLVCWQLLKKVGKSDDSIAECALPVCVLALQYSSLCESTTAMTSAFACESCPLRLTAW